MEWGKMPQKMEITRSPRRKRQQSLRLQILPLMRYGERTWRSFIDVCVTACDLLCCKWQNWQIFLLYLSHTPTSSTPITSRLTIFLLFISSLAFPSYNITSLKSSSTLSFSSPLSITTIAWPRTQGSASWESCWAPHGEDASTSQTPLQVRSHDLVAIPLD